MVSECIAGTGAYGNAPKTKKKHVYYFQAIQIALLYKKNVFEMFRYNFSMFLDLQGSFGQNEDQSLDIIDF